MMGDYYGGSEATLMRAEADDADRYPPRHCTEHDSPARLRAGVGGYWCEAEDHPLR
jgi:hypothetical protein